VRSWQDQSSILTKEFLISCLFELWADIRLLFLRACLGRRSNIQASGCLLIEVPGAPIVQPVCAIALAAACEVEGSGLVAEAAALAAA
jgi:hypothetical protein